MCKDIGINEKGLKISKTVFPDKRVRFDEWLFSVCKRKQPKVKRVKGNMNNNILEYVNGGMNVYFICDLLFVLLKC